MPRLLLPDDARCRGYGKRPTDVRCLRVQQVHDDIIDLFRSKTKNAQQWQITPSSTSNSGRSGHATGPGRVDLRLPEAQRDSPYRARCPTHAARAPDLAGLEDLQFRDIREAAINEASARADKGPDLNQSFAEVDSNRSANLVRG